MCLISCLSSVSCSAWETGEKRVGLTAGDVEELQFLVGGSGIGQQVLILCLHSLRDARRRPR